MFETEIVAHQHVLVEAAATIGLSRNAVESLDLEGLTVAQARVRWPSFFCDETRYVRVLAYLVQNNLPFDLEVTPHPKNGARYKLHPPLDPHTLNLLSQINPAQATALAEIQHHTHLVFQRLREATLPPADEQGG